MILLGGVKIMEMRGSLPKIAIGIKDTIIGPQKEIFLGTLMATGIMDGTDFKLLDKVKIGMQTTTWK